MKKILCPTDFSETAHNAIAYAAKLAQAVGAQLTLLNVQSVFDFTPAEIVMGKEATNAGIARQLEELSRAISKTFKISCYAELDSSFSKLSSIIHKWAKGFDLIVMGTDGPDDLYQFLGGSNTYNVIIKSETPVLLIPAGYTYSEIKTMVYAYDYLGERNLPLTHLVPFVKMLNCKLTVLQVMEEAYSQEAEDDLKELQFILQSPYLKELPFEYSTIRSSDVPQSIHSYILKNKPDALSLCSAHRTFVENLFHKSIIRNISTASHYPVYVFHE